MTHFAFAMFFKIDFRENLPVQRMSLCPFSLAAESALFALSGILPE